MSSCVNLPKSYDFRCFTVTLYKWNIQRNAQDTCCIRWRAPSFILFQFCFTIQFCWYRKFSSNFQIMYQTEHFKSIADKPRNFVVYSLWLYIISRVRSPLQCDILYRNELAKRICLFILALHLFKIGRYTFFHHMHLNSVRSVRAQINMRHANAKFKMACMQIQAWNAANFFIFFFLPRNGSVCGVHVRCACA